MEILDNKSNGVLSKKRDITIDINIKQTQDELKHLKLFDVLDQNKLYQEEKKHCKRYRTTVTIKPYCTNVLYNPLTEIVYNEGSQEPLVFTDQNNNLPDNLKGDVIGKTDDVNRQYLIENTEFSNKNIGFTYHIGWDFLNNHILRNKTNKAVCPPKAKGQDSNRFNTIEDVMRLSNGTTHRFRNRFSSTEVAEGGRTITTNDQEKHLYDINDLLRFESGELDVLVKKQNGWYGIDNNSSVKTESKIVETEFHRTLNNREACSFIDFYPDRSLFSFTPKFNDFKDRYEFNWLYFFGFPYQEIYDHEVIHDGVYNSLRITSVSIEKVSKGYYITKLFSELNNNLKNGDVIDLIVKGENNSFIVSEDVHITKSLSDNSFYIDEISVIKDFIPDDFDMYNLSEENIKTINENLSLVQFRFRRKFNGVPVKYYLKTLKKIANDSFKTVDYSNGEDVSEYFENHCLDKAGKLASFNNKAYDLSFSQTLFGDNISQIYFSDELNLEYLSDKNGKPVTSVYFTLVKNNRGNNSWYMGDFNADDIEYSHAFGNLTSCTISNTPIEEIRKLKTTYDYRIVNNLNLFNSRHIEDNITIDGGIGKNEFVHSICEFSIEEQTETSLSVIHYRFNTKQRELGSDRDKYNLFKKCIFRDVKKDDMDFGGFEVEEHDLTNKVYTKDGKTISYFDRPEGYYYKPFYEIKLMERSKQVKTVHNQAMVITHLEILDDHVKLKTQHAHKLVNGTILEVHDYSNHEENVKLMVVDVYDLNFFRCRILDTTKINLIDRSNLFTIFSPRIPRHADKLKYNTYVYSDVLYYDNPIMQYKNLRNYVNLDINFFLRRQADDEHKSMLYAQGDILPRNKQNYSTTPQDIDLDDYSC